MVHRFVVEDERHAEQMGEFSDRESAVRHLQELATLPWDAQPNVAPCSNSLKCGRTYEVVEYETSTTPWQELSRVSAFEISSKGVEWDADFRNNTCAG